ncbi:TetR family transcriptional regulator [Edaphobacter aggregans]|jgi:AcrR family transcriptional regulator|uniref:TetR family transcriptional regulator n=1 Tax=Edaphobacter aggregans TaxID=570835 RepID=A0A3R9PC34_9BACT|nr:TetR/AcrR family transcriptional regulator [Edaphobacter aggregans]RSL18403.1 TetR family transcriptional regulator [Edaphobacter aggregans]
MPSTSANPRRRPQQNRAEVRRASFLQAAEQLFGTLGYEAVTMTAIAEQAQASIGTLYDYFPDKPTLALALITQYIREAEVHWAKLLQRPPARTKASIADVFIEGILEFANDRIAYLPLLGAPLAYARTKAAREPLRRTIATALQNLKPSLSADRAFLNAQVIVEIIKGMLGVYRQATLKDREAVVTEFKKVMRLYLTDTLA